MSIPPCGFLFKPQFCWIETNESSHIILIDMIKPLFYCLRLSTSDGAILTWLIMYCWSLDQHKTSYNTLCCVCTIRHETTIDFQESSAFQCTHLIKTISQAQTEYNFCGLKITTSQVSYINLRKKDCLNFLKLIHMTQTGQSQRMQR